MSDPARGRWFAMVAVRLVAAFAGMLGVVLVARAYDWPTKALGCAIVLAALWVMAIVPRAMAHRWRSRP